MSVTTTADEKLELAKEKIKEARQLLIEAVNEDTWGSENLSEVYKFKMWDSIRDLAKIKMNLE